MKIVPNSVEDSQKDDKYQSYRIHNKSITLREDIFMLLFHPELFLICDNCERILNNSISILLVKTPEDRKDLCLTCFINMPLKSEWKYFVRPNLNVTVTEGSWNICSDLKMLKGLLKYGYGNWNYIKNYLDYHCSNFTEKEIEDHYHKYYQTQDLKPILIEFPLEVEPPNPFTPPQNQEPELSAEIEQQNTDTAGYNPKRQEHMFDYNPQAENLIANLQFLTSDAPQETELKYRLLEEYNKQVEERQKRCEFVAQHKLLSTEFNHKLLMESKVKRAVRRKMNCFSRFTQFEEYQKMVSYITLYEQMTGTIKQFMRHHRHLNDPIFDNLFLQMEKFKEERKKKHYKGAPELKIQTYGKWEGKRNIGTQVHLNCDEAREQLKKRNFQAQRMKITDISSQS